MKKYSNVLYLEDYFKVSRTNFLSSISKVLFSKISFDKNWLISLIFFIVLNSSIKVYIFFRNKSLVGTYIHLLTLKFYNINYLTVHYILIFINPQKQKTLFAVKKIFCFVKHLFRN